MTDNIPDDIPDDRYIYLTLTVLYINSTNTLRCYHLHIGTFSGKLSRSLMTNPPNSVIILAVVSLRCILQAAMYWTWQ